MTAGGSFDDLEQTGGVQQIAVAVAQGVVEKQQGRFVVVGLEIVGQPVALGAPEQTAAVVGKQRIEHDQADRTGVHDDDVLAVDGLLALAGVGEGRQEILAVVVVAQADADGRCAMIGARSLWALT